MSKKQMTKTVNQGPGVWDQGLVLKKICVNQCNLWTYVFNSANSCNSWVKFPGFLFLTECRGLPAQSQE